MRRIAEKKNPQSLIAIGGFAVLWTLVEFSGCKATSRWRRREDSNFYVPLGSQGDFRFVTAAVTA